MNYLRKLSLGIVGLLVCAPGITFAQDPIDPIDQIGAVYQEAVVLEVLETTYPIMQGREVEYQRLEVELTDGLVREVYNDYTPVGPGDRVWVSPWYNYETDTEGYFVQEVDRTSSLWWVFLAFVLVYLLIAGKHGARSLVGLAIAIASVWFLLLPALQAGYDPLWAGVGISTLILGVAIFVTHGFTIVSLVSYVGSLLAIVATVLFASWAMQVGNISGFVGDSVSTLSMVYGPTLDIYRLLLAGMIIGILGVLDDVAIMQVAVVRELFTDRQEQSLKDIFVRAMKVGREHAAALVNTLVLAYTAVALPLLLVVFSPTMQNMGEYAVPLSMNFSNELFVIEFIRSIVGSFGLVLTVPIVTILAVALYNRFPPKPGSASSVHHHHH